MHWALWRWMCALLRPTLCGPKIVAHQALLPMEFSRQEYQSQVLFPTLGYLPVSRIKHASLASPALADRFFTTIATWDTQKVNMYYLLSHL